MLSVQIQLRCLSPRALSELRVLCGQKTATDSCSVHDAFVSSFLGHNAAFRVGTVRLAGLSRRHKATKILIGTWFRSSLRTAPVATATTDGQPYRLSLRLRRRPSGGTRSSYWLYRGWRGCLRVVDPDRTHYRIDIADECFTKTSMVDEWPIKPGVRCCLCVDIEWVLSTVRICRINQFTISFPIEQPNGIACLWPPDRLRGRFKDDE